MNEFSRTEMLLGKDKTEVIAKSRVAVFGVGGVGGYAVEALARSGVGAIDVIDNDVVSVSNINRQIIALHSTVGEYKVDVIERRIKDINPQCVVTKHNVFFTPETACEFDFSVYDYVADAIDTVSGKVALAEICGKAGVPEISCMGAGNKLDPTLLEVADIYSTSVCPLAKVMRKELKQRGVTALKVVYSKEQPIVPLTEYGEQTERKKTPASCAFVPSVAGLIMAGEIIKDLTKR